MRTRDLLPGSESASDWPFWSQAEDRISPRFLTERHRGAAKQKYLCNASRCRLRDAQTGCAGGLSCYTIHQRDVFCFLVDQMIISTTRSLLAPLWRWRASEVEHETEGFSITQRTNPPRHVKQNLTAFIVLEKLIQSEDPKFRTQ